MDSLLQDVRYALRALARTPTLTAIALLTLAVGIGANATVFSFVDALTLRPAPLVASPSTLMAVFTSDFSSGPYGGSSYPDYLTIKSQASAFQQLAAYMESTGLLRDGETTDRVRIASVTGEFFDVLGLHPARGRLLAERDVAPTAERATVIGHELWQRLFGGDANVLGKEIIIDGEPHTIVGVAPEGFDSLNLGGIVHVWKPLVRRASDPAERGNRGMSIVGRLRPDATTRLAQDQLDTIAARLAQEYPETNRGTLAHPDQPRPMFVLRHTRVHPQFSGMVAMLGAVLMGAVALVLAVACANIANLLLSRATARTREISIRLALGATRRRVVRQLLTESVLLGGMGGALGVLFALWTSDVLPSVLPAEQQRLVAVSVDERVLAFTALLALAAGLIFGAVPALHALRAGASGSLHGQRAPTGEARTSVLRACLVLSQVALTFVLLVSAGLLVRTLSNALQGDLGFATRQAVLANIEVPVAEMTPDHGTQFYDEALARVRALPGIEAASLVRTLPFGRTSRRAFHIEGYQPRPGESTELHINIIEPAYFETMGIPVINGRAFDERDNADAPRVVIVNDVMAERYFGDRATGRRLEEGGGATLQIVGVIRGGKHLSVQEPPVPTVFYPLAQSYSPRMTLLARTAGDAALYMEPVRRTLAGVRSGVSVYRTITLSSHMAEVLTGERLTAGLAAVSGTMALLLAIVGVYGVVSYGVVRRTREIGVRIALGARPADVMRLVMSEGLVVTFIGIGAGVVAALGVTRLLASMLYGIGPWDVATFTAAAALLAAVALVAAWVPTQRAVRLDPAVVLRQE